MVSEQSLSEKIDWDFLLTLDGMDLKRAVFFAIQRTSQAIQYHAIDDPNILESVPRLTSLVNEHPELFSFKATVSSLARSCGLWNYIDIDNAHHDDAFVAASVTSPELGGLTLHREQIVALNTLLSGKNLILSAPTSFGKSLLVDALLMTGRYNRVAIVLPTIALLDEFRRRFARRFEGRFKIIMQQSEISTSEPTIFLGTQERLIYRDDLGVLDLTVVDEFYKLDPSRRDDRSVTLNAAVYRLLKRSRQFFFLGPNIDTVSISSEARWQFEFIKTRFSTVAVDTLDLQGVPDKRDRLIDEIGEDKNWPALVFISSPEKANKLAIELSQKMAVSDDTEEFSAWLKNNIGFGNFLSEAVEFGFGVHHGRIPRAIASHMIRLFNKGDLPVLLCTSTLIEGVNTAAKTVMIFDKKINRDDYDFFTFSNIRGRAGRLGQHQVGRVVLFNELPDRDELDVSPTFLGNDADLPDEFIVHIDEPDRSRRSDTRFRHHRDQLGLDPDGLRLASSIGFEVSLALKDAVDRSLDDSRVLVWSGWPSWNNILALCETLCSVKSASNYGAYTAKQLAFLISKLRKSNSIRDFLIEQDAQYKGAREAQDNIFKFLRSCEYGLTQHFSLIELFVAQYDFEADYKLFIGGLASWFKPEILRELDEEGIPIQIAERFFQDGDTKGSLKYRLNSLAKEESHLMTSFERDWVLDAL